MAKEIAVTKRAELYDKVWARILAMTEGAVRGSITPETFARVSVDVVLTELLRVGAILPHYGIDDRQK